MPDGGPSISFSLTPSFETVRGQRLLVARLAVGQDIVWDMMPNPTLRRSQINPRSLEDLIARQGAPERRGDAFVLRELTIDDHAIPDLPVSVSATVARLRIDGFLGFDFFAQFEEVRWRPRTNLVTLLVP